MGSINSIVEKMWQRYLLLNPDAKKIHDLFSKLNPEGIVNDHIALRTFNIAKVSIDRIMAPFVLAGYKYGGEYHFVEKKLYAKHYEHPDSRLPKIFISELLVDQLSIEAQRQIHQLVESVDSALVERAEFCFSGSPWRTCYEDYCRLLGESEYAAWMAAFGYQPNHFTISVNHLSSHRSLESVSHFLLQQGFVLNTSGGIIKGSKDVCLEQLSTVANKACVTFTDQVVNIPSCYYEFAYRYPAKNGELYQGFIAQSADKIFESTNVVTS